MTPNITIRHVEPGDLPAIQRIFTDPRVVANTLQVPLPPAELWRKRLEPQSDARILVAVVEDQVVGMCGLHTNANPRRAHAAMIGMAVHGDWQGRGVGSALLKEAIALADNWLRLLRLELRVFTDNLAAIKLYRKFGFVVEGTHVGEALRDGRFVDGYSMARLHPHPPSIQTPTEQPQTT